MIKELPNAICDLSILWKLRVDCNLLEHLPPYLGKLERLEALTASNNKLKNVPLSLY
jgi:Leucine-rich repeat (LRR) protein